MREIASFAVDPVNLLTVLIAGVLFATIVTLIGPLMQGEGLDKRLKMVASRREELRRRSRASMQGPGTNALRHENTGLFKTVSERLNLAKLLEDPKVVDKLAEAGFRGPKPVSTFYFFRLAMPFVTGAIALVFLFGLGVGNFPTITRITFSGMAFVVGFYLPNVYLANAIAKRRASIVQAFPDALDLLLICVESGMSIEAAIQKVSAEVGGSSIELAEELTLLSAELSYLPERRMAYEGIAKRVNYPGVKSVMTAMIQAERYGTPLGQALRVMAKENRDMRLSAAEKKAAALPAKLTVPMILFFLPVLFVVIMTPALIQVFGWG